MHPRKRLSIKSATVAGIAASAPCWGLQVSFSIQRQPRRSYTASTLNISSITGQASCLSLGRWRALRFIITPVAMQTVALIALGAGGKALFRGSRALGGTRYATRCLQVSHRVMHAGGALSPKVILVAGAMAAA